MSTHAVALVALGLYIAACGLILIDTFVRAPRGRRTSDIDREALGTRRYPWWLIGVTVSVTMLGPADALGLSGRGFEYGLIWAIAPLGAAIAQVVAGLFFVGKIKDQPGRNQTLGDLLEVRFGPSSRPMIGFIVVLQAIAFAGVLVLAGAQVLEVFAGVPKVYGLIFVSLFIGVFTAIGGLSSVVKGDQLQGTIMVIALIAIVILAVIATPDTLTLSTLSYTTPKFHAEYTAGAIIGVMLTYMFGEFLLPIYSQRALIARTPDGAKWGFVLAGGLAAIWYIVIAGIGVVAQSLPGNSSDPDFVIFDIIRTALDPGGWPLKVAMAFSLICLIALLHSTFDGILNAGGVAFARDLANGLISIDDTAQGKLARRAMIGIAALGMIIPFIWNDLIEILLVGYTIWAPTLMPILAWTLVTKRRRYAAWVFWIPLLGGGLGWFYAQQTLPESIPAILVGVAANVLLLLVAVALSARLGKVTDLPEIGGH